MTTAITTTSGLIDIGTTQLYFEVCNRGPTLMPPDHETTLAPPRHAPQ
jgi:hypothetical protein